MGFKSEFKGLRIVVRVLFPVFDNSVVLFRIQKVLGYSLDAEITPIFCDIPHSLPAVTWCGG